MGSRKYHKNKKKVATQTKSKEITSWLVSICNQYWFLFSGCHIYIYTSFYLISMNERLSIPEQRERRKDDLDFKWLLELRGGG